MKSAAAVVPRLPDGRVLVGTRTHAARSWPGTVAFPGGGSEESDAKVLLASGALDTERACALRELFEETGVLLACTRAGTADAGAASRAIERVTAGAPIVEALSSESLVFDDRRLLPGVLWRTWGKAFAVRQFLLPVKEGEIAPREHTDELSHIHFADPRALIRGWQAGEVFLIAPIRRVLSELAQATSQDDAHTRMMREPTDRERARMDLVDGAVMLSARTPTLPPATHTNSPLLGKERCLLIDPATPYTEEHERFDRWLDASLGRARLEAIVLTHHHIDHVGDAARLKAKLGVEVWAHHETADRVDVKVDRLLSHDERITLEDGFSWRVVFTPGHAQGHICLLEERTHLLIAGDMVAGIGSILIDPPEGHMGTYLKSLDALVQLGPRGLIPSHGYLMADGVGRLQEQLAHRGKRQAAVRGALTTDPRRPHDLVPEIYGADTPRQMFPLAERSLLAALELCVELGEAVRVGDAFKRA